MHQHLEFNEFGDLQFRDASRHITVVPRLWDFAAAQVSGSEIIISSPLVGDVTFTFENFFV